MVTAKVEQKISKISSCWGLVNVLADVLSPLHETVIVFFVGRRALHAIEDFLGQGHLDISRLALGGERSPGGHTVLRVDSHDGEEGVRQEAGLLFGLYWAV